MTRFLKSNSNKERDRQFKRQKVTDVVEESTSEMSNKLSLNQSEKDSIQQTSSSPVQQTEIISFMEHARIGYQQEPQFLYQTPVKIVSENEFKQSQSTIEQTPTFIDSREDIPANLISSFYQGEQIQNQKFVEEEMAEVSPQNSSDDF